MARILITSGPTRQYLDPVRYLTNASSGRMGCALAEAALERGHAVVVVSGPVSLTYPSAATVHPVITTEEMLEVCRQVFPGCDGMIGVAAPCDYRPQQVQPHKIAKTGAPLALELVETPDVVATLASEKSARQWVVGFALDSEDQHFRAITKMQQKSCDLMVVNSPQAIDAQETQVALLAPSGAILARFQGSKADVARQLMGEIHERLVEGSA